MFFLLFPFLPRVLVLKQQAWEERYLGLDLKNSQGPALGQQWNFKTKFADSLKSALTGNSSNTNNFVKDFINKTYRVFIKYCVFFPRILESLPPLPRQHSAAIGCTKNYQPIGVTVNLHCVESFDGFLQRCSRGRGCREL